MIEETFLKSSYRKKIYDERAYFIAQKERRKMRVEREEKKGKQNDVKALVFLKAACAEVVSRRVDMPEIDRQYYIAQGVIYGFIIAQGVLELSGAVKDELLSDYIDRSLDAFLL